MKNAVLFILFICLFSCAPELSTLNEGEWRGTIDAQDGEKIPFLFEVNLDGNIVMRNASERILVDEITVYGDSIKIQMPVYEGYFLGRFSAGPTGGSKKGNVITGDFIKSSLGRVVPFTMSYGENQARFEYIKKVPLEGDVTGRWETVFSPDKDGDRYDAIGIFEQEGSKVKGTFRTTTGDYRFLEGSRNGNTLRLSTFDGAHAFLFTATVKGDSLEGVFYSGDHWREPFRAKRNSTYELPDANDLTFLKDDYDGISFTFPDATGKTVSLADERFKDKVVIVQILGGWCPNCLEETKFLVDYLKEYPNDNLEIVGLAFEYAPTQEKAFASIQRLKDRLEVPYPILLAQYGTEDKKLANEKLPMLNHVLSYPTSIYIDKKATVRRIHTGFNGKATGEKFVEFQKDFKTFLNELMAE